MLYFLRNNTLSVSFGQNHFELKRVRILEQPDKECLGNKGSQNVRFTAQHASARVRKSFPDPMSGETLQFRGYYECHLTAFAEYSN